MRSPCACVGLACCALACSGCSIFSYEPTWELVKAGGATASYMIAGIPPKASDTVRHGLVPHFSRVCIAFNPDVQSMEMVPAIQAALQQRQIESRVFDSVASSLMCPAWLHYAAVIAWDTPPMTSGFRSYVSQAWLTLKTDDGRVLASSSFALGGVLEIGKWASTQDKVDAVINALLGVPNAASGV